MIPPTEKIAKKIATVGRKPKTRWEKVMTHTVSWTLYLIIIPIGLLHLSAWTEERYLFTYDIWIAPLGIGLIVYGLILVFWTADAQDKHGEGTPLHLHPTQRLITTGPYSYLRNPMSAGILYYYFGLGAATGHPAMIFIWAPLYGLIAIASLKLVEEKELEHRFGDEYRDYKKNVPMLFPRPERRK